MKGSVILIVFIKIKFRISKLDEVKNPIVLTGLIMIYNEIWIKA